ncbi:MAG: hypothetical protein K8R87_02230 [Verrucomicrobia bacterium]|nr:hypothetical protein [Verrucomicrobiota bacterium]
MTMIRTILALTLLLFASCRSTLPNPADMQRYYAAAEQQAQRDIDHLADLKSRGEISSEEYQRREEMIKDSIPRRANQMAWARHELTQSEMRAMGIPTPDGPGVAAAAPTRGAVSGSFYRPPGQSGGGSNSSIRNQGIGGGGSLGSMTNLSGIQN